MRVSAGALVLVAIVLAGQAGDVWRAGGDGPRSAGRPELAPLARALGARRPIDGRLTGGFAHAEPRRALDEGTRRAVLAAAFPLFPPPGEPLTPERQSGIAAAYLLIGRVDDAVPLLESAIALAGPVSGLASAGVMPYPRRTGPTTSR